MMMNLVAGPAVGVGTPLSFNIPAPRLVAYARAAEEAGLDDVSVGELRSTEVFALASAMIAATSRIRVETSIVTMVSRAPTLIAMAAATLNQLSAGRFHLGIGAGTPIVAGWHGTELKAPVKRMERTVGIVRAALAGERIEDFGSFRIAREMQGSVPIVLSAMNERMLKLAGRVADGVVIQFVNPEQAARMGAIARAARREAGVDEPFEVIVNLWGYAGDDEGSALAAFRQEMGPYLAVPTYRAASVALASEAEVDAAAELWRAGGRDAAAAAVPKALSDALLVVLGAEDVQSRFDAYGRAGVDRVRVVPLSPTPGDDGNARRVVAELGDILARRPAAV